MSCSNCCPDKPEKPENVVQPCPRCGYHTCPHCGKPVQDVVPAWYPWGRYPYSYPYPIWISTGTSTVTTFTYHINEY